MDVAWPILPEAVFFAAGGGFAIKLLDLAELANVRRANWPKFDFAYVLIFLINPLLGAFLAYAYVSSGMELKPIVAVNVGISAPLILRAMANRDSSKILSSPEGA